MTLASDVSADHDYYEFYIELEFEGEWTDEQRDIVEAAAKRWDSNTTSQGCVLTLVTW